MRHKAVNSNKKNPSPITRIPTLLMPCLVSYNNFSGTVLNALWLVPIDFTHHYHDNITFYVHVVFPHCACSSVTPWMRYSRTFHSSLNCLLVLSPSCLQCTLLLSRYSHFSLLLSVWPALFHLDYAVLFAVKLPREVYSLLETNLKCCCNCLSLSQVDAFATSLGS